MSSKGGSFSPGHPTNSDSLGKLSMKDSDRPDPPAIEHFLERVLLITVAPDSEPHKARPAGAVSLKGCDDLCPTRLSLDFSLGQALFERIRMKSPYEKLVFLSPLSSDADDSVAELRILFYLYQCYSRSMQEARKVTAAWTEAVGFCQQAIVDNLATVITSGADLLDEPQNMTAQLQELLNSVHFGDAASSYDGGVLMSLLTALAQEMESSDSGADLKQLCQPLLESLAFVFKGFMGQPDFGVMTDENMELLFFFASSKSLAELFWEYNTPANIRAQGAPLVIYVDGTGKPVTGARMENTVLGILLTCSVLPNPYHDNTGDFGDTRTLTATVLSDKERRFWMFSESLSQKVSEFFLKMVRLSAHVKHLALTWIGICLRINKALPSMDSLHSRNMYRSSDCTDGFMINLSSVLLRMSQPFCKPGSPKLQKITHVYTQYQYIPGSDDSLRCSHHLPGLPSMTFLNSWEKPDMETSTNATPPKLPSEPAQPFGFITELYFMTAFSLHLGFTSVFERLNMMNNDLGRLQARLGPDGSGQSLPPHIAEAMRKKLNDDIKVFLCMKCGLTEEAFYDLALGFHVASASYLVSLTESAASEVTTTSVPGADGGVEDDGVSDPLTHIPEFVLNTLIDTLLLVQRYKGSYSQKLNDHAGHLLDVIVTFMGSRTRVRSPHLRSNLAAVLEGLLPTENTSDQLANYYRAPLFTDHPKAAALSEALLNVFVGIEITGQGVSFEEKFQCRRPMHRILAYLLNIKMHQKAIQDLARQSEEKMSDNTVPLFMQFINLLTNDAIFLLDEAFSSMQTIKESEEEKERGEWESLPPSEVQEKENSLRQSTQLARSTNILSRDTTSSLRLLTRHTQSVFCHASMVNRIAAMLNYLLQHLTSKAKMKTLKVRNMDTVDFKPHTIVSDICDIYLNLSESTSFQEAIGQDGRCYSPALFEEAEAVLRKIFKPAEDIEKFRELAARVKVFVDSKTEEEAYLADAPDEYLDPIMSTIMIDPVLLPTSGNVVDRVTISRHLLSDQIDPFNRKPLTLDMVQDQPELKAAIELWVQNAKVRKQ